MKRVFLPIAHSLFVAALTLSAMAGAYAAEPTAVAKADPAKGEALYNNGDGARNIIACVACHGAAGNSTIAQNPKLAAQHEAYLHKQLIDFTGPTRNNAIMTGMAKALSPEDMKNISAYLSVQKASPGAAQNKDIVDIGKKIYRAGIAEANIPACAGCHSPNGAGIPAQYPRIAGQHQDYTVAQLTSYRAGTRSNSIQMTAVAKRMSDEEIKAVADYVAGLK